MTSRVFIIAECGSNWRFGNELENAYRMIRACKEAGSDSAKFQWVSDYKQLMSRRKATMDAETERVYSYVHFPVEWLPLLKAECDRVGIEFMCTAYLPQDVAVIAPFVKRFKVAAKEAWDKELLNAIAAFRGDKEVIRSITVWEHRSMMPESGLAFDCMKHLYCVSKYPAPLEELKLNRWYMPDGFSDHSAHVLTGAVAVGAGARIIESHVRLHDTPKECPDYGHSLVCDFPEHWTQSERLSAHYLDYAQNIRVASRML